MTIKRSITAGGLVGVLGAAAWLGLTEPNSTGTVTSLAPGSDGKTQICMLNDAPFFADLKKGCYSREFITGLEDHDLLNGRGGVITITLSSPPSAAEATDECRTCKDYHRMRGLGWFTLTNRDQRREAFFQRACGMLSMLEDAALPKNIVFDDGNLSIADLETIPTQSLLQFTPAPDNGARADGDTEQSGTAQKNRTSPRRNEQGPGWNITVDDFTINIQPLAHADFDGDGSGDILIYMNTKANDGTVSGGVIGYLTKQTLEGPIKLVVENS